ncbi:MAG: 2-octaprenyl-6-methoxyphenol hydroxylase [Methylophagaceae bacterium]|jgi:2-octaprenyl-6-methoxyphenol hydroxylase
MAVTDYDIIIVGGGMVGASLAYALKNSHHKIALIEAFDFKTTQQPSYDDRGIALSYGSQRIFNTMGLWPKLAPHCTAITDIHISDRGHFGSTRLSAQQENVPALGQVILARAMGKVLNQAMSENTTLDILCPRKVVALTQRTDHVDLCLDDGQHILGNLIVAADGANSTIRRLLNLTATEQVYQQTAITANISTERSHNNRAFERFTEFGPIALLPMPDNRCSLIWTVKTGDELVITELDDVDFLARLQSEFGYRLGKITQVGKRNHYPLKLTQTDQPIQERIVFVGNAAHNLHPIAGQGFNLGLRDVIALADVLIDETDDCGNPRNLLDYQQWQQQDQDSIIKATDLLVRLFSNNNPILGSGRSAGLMALDLIPPAKHWLAKQSMGLGKKQPRLARGITL